MAQAAKLTKQEQKALNQMVLTAHKSDRPYKLYTVVDTVKFIIMAVLFALSLRLYVFEFTLVEGPSMQNTLLDGERMLVEKISFRLTEPKRGTIIICKFPTETEDIVKRVVGLPGETVEIINGVTHIDGKPLDESGYIKAPMDVYENLAPVTVPPRSVFVMGDNRDMSKDSRSHSVGPIPYNQIRGHVLGVIWPFSEFRIF